MLMALALLGLAQADPVDLELTARAQSGQGHPALVLVVNDTATSLDVTLRCGDGTTARSSGPRAVGERVTLELPVRQGSHRCTGTLAAEFSDGSAGEMPLSFEVASLPPLKLQVPREQVDLENNSLQVIMDRPPGKVVIEAYGPHDALIGSATVPAVGASAGQPFELQWAADGELLRLHVVGYDSDGFWSAVDLLPWSYEIPHEDVVFGSGLAVIEPDQEPALQAVMAEIQSVRERYGDTARMNLYVAGYTDTVGDRAGNQDLSRRRAAAIARWFRAQGFQGEIWYQGFGEDALAVPTPDSTDEPANRRAVYLLAAEAPATSSNIPRSQWTQL